MKVWIVVEVDVEAHIIRGVFATEESAQKEAAQYSEYRLMEVQEWEVRP